METRATQPATTMEDALSGNVAEFGGFDGMESVLTCAKPVEHVCNAMSGATRSASCDAAR
jgi:hypothetical protein